MWNKLTNKNSITGFVAILLSTSSFFAQFVLEGWAMNIEQWITPLGVASITFFVGGVVLVVWNFFRKELIFEQQRKIVEDRQTYLPHLKNVIDKFLSRKYELAIQAGRLSLEEYHKKYLRLNNKYDKAYKRYINKDTSVRR